VLDGRGRALNSLSVFFVASRMDKLFARFLPLRFGKRSPLASLNFKYKSPLPFSFVQNGSSRLSGLTRRRLFSSGKSSGGRGRGRKAGREGGKEAGDGSGQRQKDNLFDFFAFLKRSATDNKETLHFLGGIVVVGSIMHVWANYVLNVTLVIGPSMLPTFNRAGDIVLSDALTPRFTGFHAGDVVVAASPTDPKKSVCKRIRAVEGDTVKVPMTDHGGFRYETHEIPKGHVWLQGDNPLNSTDSRQYGPVPVTMLKYRIFCRVYPLNEMQLISSEPNKTLPGTVIAGGSQAPSEATA
jgi:mitochondrial inner membrane protease subunit 1